jgi:NADH-quinone oxidoreductase subunit E
MALQRFTVHSAWNPEAGISYPSAWAHVRGGARVNDKLEELLNVSDGQTTEDKRFTLESVRCIGCCSLGPVVKINEDMHGRIGTDEVEKVLEQYE